MPAPRGYARIAASLSLGLFVAVSTGSASASAVTAQWQAKIGPGGADGTSTIQIFSTGAGSLSIALKGLAHGTTYTDAVYRGTCSKLSTKLLALPPLKTTAKGTFARTTTLAAPQATLVNKKGEVFRLVAGKHVFCGPFLGGSVPYAAATVAVGPYPLDIATGFGVVWVTNAADNTVSKIDPATNTVMATIVLASPGHPERVAVGESAVWVDSINLDPTSYDLLPGLLIRLDPGTNAVLATIPVGLGAAGIAVSPGAVWVANSNDHSVTRIDPATNAVVATIPVGNGYLAGVAFGGGSVWVIDNGDPRTISRIDPATNHVVATIQLHVAFLEGVAVSPGAVWVSGADTLVRIDAATNTVVASIALGSDPFGIAADARYVWVAMGFEQTVVQVDARTDMIAHRVAIGATSTTVAIGDQSVWVVRWTDGSCLDCPGTHGAVIRINY